MVVRFTCLFLLLNFSMLKAQVVVNEFSASNLASYIDNYTKAEDWIELYNTSDSEVNLEGWYLSDNDAKPTKWSFPTGVKISAHDYLVVFASGRDEFKNGKVHTDFKLNQTEQKDYVILSKPDKSLVDKIKLPITQVEQSVCRSMDGGAAWVYSRIATPGANNQSTEGYQFSAYSAKPQVTVTSGNFDNTVVVRLLNSFPDNVKVRYTLNGYAPSQTSALFPDSIEIAATTVLKLIAFDDDTTIFHSFCEFNTYFINEEFSVPVFSVAADKLTDMAEGEKELRPVGSIEYFDKSRTRKSIGYGELNSHGQDSWVLNQRSLDWITRDEMGYSAAIYQPIFDLSEREEFQRFIFRASGDDNYPAINDGAHEGSTHLRDEYVHTLAKEGNMSLDVRTPQRCIVFLNGQYWGVYAVRERPDDHDYTDFYYKQDKYDLQYLATWGGSWAEYGEGKAFSDWTKIRNFVLQKDMSIDSNYVKVDAAIDLVSLSDYFIMNLNVVASDWLNYNTGWWRGLNEKGTHKKWGYTLWDNDATFDYYINYSGVPDISPYAEPCDINQIATFINNFFNGNDLGKHEKILLRLLDQNADFRQLYYSRYADLMNTVFSCDNMISTLDRMIADIEPDMPRHVERWGGNMTEWHKNLKRLKDFIEIRCTKLADNLAECYEPENSYLLTIMTDPPDVGEIKLNTLNHTSLPWSGTYYDNMNQLISTKRTNDAYEFSHWSSKGSKITIADSSLLSTKIELFGRDTLVANYKSPLSAQGIDKNAITAIYPNPTNSILNVKLQNSGIEKELSYSILNVSGRTVLSKKLDLIPNGNNFTISLSELDIAEGVYFLKITSNQRSSINKFTFIK